MRREKKLYKFTSKTVIKRQLFKPSQGEPGNYGKLIYIPPKT